MQDLTGNNKAGMFVVAGFMLLSAVVVLALRRGVPTREAAVTTTTGET